MSECDCTGAGAGAACWEDACMGYLLPGASSLDLDVDLGPGPDPGPDPDSDGPASGMPMPLVAFMPSPAVLDLSHGRLQVSVPVPVPRPPTPLWSLAVLDVGANLLVVPDGAAVLAQQPASHAFLDVGNGRLFLTGQAALQPHLALPVLEVQPEGAVLDVEARRLFLTGAAALALAPRAPCGPQVAAMLRPARAAGPAPWLVALDLSHNALGGVAAAEALGAVLGTMSELLVLNLSATQLGAAGVAALAPALGGLARLEVLDVGGNALGAAGAAALGPALARLGALCQLDLRDNALGPAAAARLVGALGCAPVWRLDLGHNGLGRGDAAPASAPGGKRCGALAALLARCLAAPAVADDDADVDADCVALRALALKLRRPGLQHLVLDGNALGCRGLRALGPALRGAKALDTLDLSDNALGPRGYAFLAAALPTMPALRTLALCGNAREGTAPLARAQCTRTVPLNMWLEDGDAAL